MFLGIRATLVLVAAFALSLTFSSGAAIPEGKIGVYGANGGSHLRVFVRGNHVVVKGWMARSKPAGCHYAKRRMKAICPLRGVGAMEIKMGPNGDMVEILDRLPVPLTVYLGAGSDKFIGNGERDTCYPGGSRRNRCVGGGGNDVCITGNQNSDCVGGSGSDYCQHGKGSDGCWGGPGRDVCRMGPGHDGCHGDGGDDVLFGGSSSDRLYGGGGRDHCDGGRGWGKSQGCEAGPRR